MVWPVAFQGEEKAVVPWSVPLTYRAMVWALLSYTPVRWYQVPVAGVPPVTCFQVALVESELRAVNAKVPLVSCR